MVSLLNEMVDREAIAQFPDPPYTLKQFSSYDRATVQPGDSTWFANRDRTMFIRIDTLNGRKEYVMFDAKGPGAVVRFWMTFSGENSGHGILRIYFDNEDHPSIEGKAFDLISGGQLTGEPLSSSVSDSTIYEKRGHNLYLPLPYANHCRITYESENIKDFGARTGEAVYYNINYRTYSKQVKVISFSEQELTKAKETIQKVQIFLRKRENRLEKLSLKTTSINETIPPEGKATFQFEGNNAVRLVKIRLSSDSLEQSLRTTILEMTFDGNRTVWCPIGDFFGTGYQIRFSNTWNSSVETDGTMTSYWTMPFKEAALISILNIGANSVSVEGEMAISPWKWDKRSMHFGTSWHQYTKLYTGDMKNTDGGGGVFDINFTELTGKGVYVGDALVLYNTVYRWWGEGDEKIYIDGEKFPSHIGTGTEDYYGYAWCKPEKFTNHPFIAQPDGSGNFQPGYTVNIRQRGLDAIPFCKSLKMDMEMWHKVRAVINYAPATYWYVLPDGQCSVLPDHVGALAKVALDRTDIVSPFVIMGKIEAESMILKGFTGGSFRYDNSQSAGWSDNVQASWINAKPGDKLILSFINEEAGVYNLSIKVTGAPDYGKYSIRINQKTIPGINDAFNNQIITKIIDLGNHTIFKGENEMAFELADYCPDGIKAGFGFDFLSLNKPSY